MQSITEPLPYTLVLRKIIIYNFLFSVQGPRLLKYVPKSHNFSMWRRDKQNNETCKKNKKENYLTICKYQKNHEMFWKGPQEWSVHCTLAGEIRLWSLRHSYPLFPKSEQRGFEILFFGLITGPIKKGCPQAKSSGEEWRQWAVNLLPQRYDSL